MDASKNIKRMLYNTSKTTGKGSVVIYYSISGTVKRFNTGIKVDASKWDSEKHQPKKGGLSATDAATVDNLYNSISSIITNYQFKYNSLPPVQHIEEQLNKPAGDGEDIHALLQEYLIVKKRKTKAGSEKNLMYLAEHLQEFEKYNKKKITLQNVDYGFIEKFTEYFINKRKKKLNANSFRVRLAAFKEFVIWLNKKGISHNIKTQNWEKLDSVETNMICVERHELDAIMNYQPENEKEEYVKDVVTILSNTVTSFTTSPSISLNSISVCNSGILEHIARKSAVHKCTYFIVGTL